MRYLAIDVGTKKTGIAISDEEGKIAFPHETVPHTEVLEAVLALVTEKKVAVVVVGESKNLQGEENVVMKNVREIVDALRAHSIPVELESEEFTTQAARRLGAGTDDQAASILLQGYLDRKRTDDYILYD